MLPLFLLATLHQAEPVTFGAGRAERATSAVPVILFSLPERSLHLRGFIPSVLLLEWPSTGRSQQAQGLHISQLPMITSGVPAVSSPALWRHPMRPAVPACNATSSSRDDVGAILVLGEAAACEKRRDDVDVARALSEADRAHMKTWSGGKRLEPLLNFKIPCVSYE